MEKHIQDTAVYEFQTLKVSVRRTQRPKDI
jgi:hypothetical protein